MSKATYQDGATSFAWSRVLDDLEWNAGSDINLGHTIIDRHADRHGVALYWIGEKGCRLTITYRDVRALSNKVANPLRSLGVGRGDRVAGVMPRGQL